MFIIEQVDNIYVKNYETFMFTSHKDVLSEKDKNTSLAIGIKMDETPIGLAVAVKDIYKEGKWLVLSIYIDVKYRGKGAGELLYNKLEEFLLEKHCNRMEMIYVLPEEKAVSANKFLTSHGWLEPIRIISVYRMNSTVKNCSFVKSAIENKIITPKNISYIPIKDINEDEKRQIIADLGGVIPENLSPYINEIKTDNNISLAVLCDNKVAGWSLAFKENESAIHYRSIYIRPEFRKFALGMYLLNEVIKRHFIYYENCEVIFAIENENNAMKQLIHRIFDNRFIYIRHGYGTHKE